jgi:methyl coenzyme M reductase subunit D
MSPEMVAHLIRPELLSLMIYSFEVLRRGMWNFIRVEYKHIEICKEFKVTMKVELPFRKDKEGRFFLRDGTILDYVKMNQRIKKLSTKYVDSVLRKQIFNGNTFESILLLR